MSLTSAMQVGFTGIQSNSVTVDTVGNNLANANTTAYKSQRTLFETLLYRTVSEGNAPTDTNGGTLPEQIGYGSTVASMQRNFKQGSTESTGFASDLAIDGKGFFILENGSDDQLYTRDGSFLLDKTNTLVTAAGRAVQVYQVDAGGSIDTSALGRLVVPIGLNSDPLATANVIMSGSLNADGDLASGGAVLSSQALTTGGAAPATAQTQLTALVDADGVPMFATGDEIAINAAKGGISLPESTFTVGTTGSTLGDLAGHLQNVLGINTDPTLGGSPGVSIVDGALVVNSNIGMANAVGLDSAAITNTTTPTGQLLSFTTTTPASGEQVDPPSFSVFDSLGNPVEVRLRLAMESKTDAGTTWRFFAESTGDTDPSSVLGTGTISFDQSGRFLSATGTTLSIDRANVGAVTPLTFELDFTALTGHAGSGGASQVTMGTEDGRESGVLTDYQIRPNGEVIAGYSNEYEQLLGQVALATFANEEGLVALGENTYRVGVNSGAATLFAPQSNIAGSIVQGALEAANVEIAEQFIGLITAQTGISSSSRVIRVADDLLQELLLLAR